ncbi:hypothetical protein C8F01DRAFT_1242686 [Mycena amicta]|nr:hypothetical protein C8F01DRAFT_1242686 [Mycena amicta]
MGRTAHHLTKADQKEAARGRVVKYNHSERGKSIRAAQRQQRHRRKQAGGVLGKVSPLPALLVEHASFELPVDEPGFLDGYSPDFDLQDARFASWWRFPIFPPPSRDNHHPPDSTAYRQETCFLEAVFHGNHRRLEQEGEWEQREIMADMHPSASKQRWQEEYGYALQSWRFWLPSLAKYKSSEREETLFLLHIHWKARRAFRLYYGIAQSEDTGM